MMGFFAAPSCSSPCGKIILRLGVSMKESIEKAKTLIESLPYIKEFYDRIIVIKYGGHAMVDEELKKNFALDVILMKYIGINPVIVHGGGPQINQFLKKMNIQSDYVHGMRVTDGETMDVVEMVLVGKVNKEIVSLINYHGGKAVGLSGRDGELVQARKMKIMKSIAENTPPELIDLGRVGEVTRVNPDVLVSLDARDFIPVIAPVGVGEDGRSYNINADLVAGAIAAEINAAKLILLTDVQGVLDQKGKLIPTLSCEEAERHIASGLIAGGMIPKVNCCRAAVNAGVSKAHIIDGRIEHAILLEMFTKQGIGTEIVA
jgi:acetylglutamate kinase